MTVPWPADAPSLWNVVKLGTITLPGIATVAIKKGDEVEVKKPKGKAGATTTVQGPKPATVAIELTFLRTEEMNAWYSAVKVLLPAKESGAPQSIDHPKTAGYYITKVKILDIDDGANEKGDVYKVKISCVEFNPPPKASKATKTPKTLEPRDNNLASGSTGNYIKVEKPSRDPKNKGPKPT